MQSIHNEKLNKIIQGYAQQRTLFVKSILGELGITPDDIRIVLADSNPINQQTAKQNKTVASAPTPKYKAAKQKRTKVTNELRANIAADLRSGTPGTDIAEKYNIAKSTVYRIHSRM